MRGLVMPQIVREVMSRIAETGEEAFDEWVEGWLDLAARLGQELPPDIEDDAREAWVENVVAAYAESMLFATKAEDLLRVSEAA
jgi:hypothetical protein